MGSSNALHSGECSRSWPDSTPSSHRDPA